MDTVLRAVLVYLTLLVILRIAGRRTLGESSPFDLVLLLLIAETAQPALVGEDSSFTTMALIVITLVTTDVVLSYLKVWSPALDRWLDGRPTALIENGEIRNEALRRARIDMNDILLYARRDHGILSPEGIRHAILESDGHITIIPRQDD